jgi:hypothetical protein
VYDHQALTRPSATSARTKVTRHDSRPSDISFIKDTEGMSSISKTNSLEELTMSPGRVTEEHLLAMKLRQFRALLEKCGMNYQSFDDSLLVRSNTLPSARRRWGFESHRREAAAVEHAEHVLYIP